MKEVLRDEHLYVPEGVPVKGSKQNNAWWYTAGAHSFNYPVDGDKILSDYNSYEQFNSDISDK